MSAPASARRTTRSPISSTPTSSPAAAATPAAAGKWNFAWALHAGASMQVNQNLALDVGYSFVSLGDAQTGTLINFNGTCATCAPMTFKNIYSHDLKLGLRYCLRHAAVLRPGRRQVLIASSSGAPLKSTVRRDGGRCWAVRVTPSLVSARPTCTSHRTRLTLATTRAYLARRDTPPQRGASI